MIPTISERRFVFVMLYVGRVHVPIYDIVRPYRGSYIATVLLHGALEF